MACNALPLEVLAKITTNLLFLQWKIQLSSWMPLQKVREIPCRTLLLAPRFYALPTLPNPLMLTTSIDSGALAWPVRVTLCPKTAGRKWWPSNPASILTLILRCDILLNNLCSKATTRDMAPSTRNKNPICKSSPPKPSAPCTARPKTLLKLRTRWETRFILVTLSKQR